MCKKRATPVSTSVRELKGNLEGVMLVYLELKLLMKANEKITNLKEDNSTGSRSRWIKVPKNS